MAKVKATALQSSFGASYLWSSDNILR